MNDADPALRDRLAAEYALGTLQGAARRRFERLLPDQQPLGDAVQAWQLRLNRLAKAVPPVAPPAHAWAGIARRIAPPPPPPARERRLDRLWDSPGFWRGVSAVATAAAAALAVHAALQPRGAGERDAALDAVAPAPGPVPSPTLSPTLSHVAVLLDKDKRPMMTADLDLADGRLVLRLNIRPPRDFTDKRLEVWLVPPGGAPRSLGLFPGEASGTTAVLDLSREVARTLARSGLAVSLEPTGGSTKGAPSGPVLFSGAVVPVDA